MYQQRGAPYNPVLVYFFRDKVDLPQHKSMKRSWINDLFQLPDTPPEAPRDNNQFALGAASRSRTYLRSIPRDMMDCIRKYADYRAIQVCGACPPENMYEFGGATAAPTHLRAIPRDCTHMILAYAVMSNWRPPKLYPYPGGQYQPSGHINTSRARDFYSRYTTGAAAATTNPDPAMDAIMDAAIVSLMISDGSQVLRYS